MKKIFFLFALYPFLGDCQTIYNPEVLYDSPGGIFDKDSVRDIYLDFYDPNYHSYLVNSWFYTPDHRIPAKLTLNGMEYDSVGVRYKGNSTFCLPNDNFNSKVPYNIDINHFVSGQKLLGYKKIKLANAWMDPTFSKEFAASNIYRKYLPSPEVNLVKLHTQGSYLGLYVNTESINKEFLNKHFNEKSGTLFKCDNIDRFCDTINAPTGLPPDLTYLGEDSSLYYNNYDLKSDHGWSDLIDLIRTLNNDFTQIENVLNVDRTLWAFAVNQVIANYDTYNGYYVHNYYLYQTEDGLFQMIPWDSDNAFVGALMGFDYWTPSTVYEFDPYYGENMANVTHYPYDRPLISQLLNHPVYRKQYTAHLRTIISESLNPTAINDQVDELQARAYTGALNDGNKQHSMNDYSNNVDNAIFTWWGFGGIISTVNERKTYLLSHSEIGLVPPTISLVQEASNGTIITAVADNVSTVELMATVNNHASKFQAFTMYDDGTNGDITSGDGVFSVNRPFSTSNEVLKYYVRAQNNDAMKLSPERAEYQYYYSDPLVGINELALSTINIIPNPMIDQAQLFWDNPTKQEVNIEILDVTGKLLKRFVNYENVMTLKRGNLTSGVYVVSVVGANYKLQQKLIVR